MTVLSKLSLVLGASAVSAHAPTASTHELFRAVSANHKGRIDDALSDGAHLDHHGHEIDYTYSGQTPLMHAVLGGHHHSVEHLLNKGADIWITEQDGYSPIHGATFAGHPDITKKLIDHFKKQELLDREDIRKDWEERGINRINRLVRDVHADWWEPIFRAAWGHSPEHTETVRMLLEEGVPPDAIAGPKGKRETLLQAAEKSGNEGTIKLVKDWLEKHNATPGPKQRRRAHSFGSVEL